MNKFSRREVVSFATALALTTGRARGAEQWAEGRHYFKLNQPQAPQTGAITVTEIFSYGCPACAGFLPFMEGLVKKLPASVSVDYLPASWNPTENWPAFQRTYITAKALGAAAKAHAAMFAAVWKTGELAVVDATSGRAKSPLPSMQAVASLYQRVAAVPSAKFLETARSFSVETEMKRSDALIKTYRAELTPTIIVNGKYRTDPRSAGGAQELADLALWLVLREQQAKSANQRP
ncbi:MAG: thiol:disulfide interchange protein DsbA/DsbL [Steroidobacteraceae bacterium]